MHCSRHAPRDGSCVVFVGSGLPRNEPPTTVGESDHDGTSGLLCPLHAGIDGTGAHIVHPWDGKPVLLGVIEQVDQGLAGHNARLHGGRHLGEGGCLLVSGSDRCCIRHDRARGRNRQCPAQAAPAVQVLHRLDDALGHAHLPRTKHHARVVVRLVGLLRALGVPKLRLQVVHVLFLVAVDAVPEGPMSSVNVEVDLDDASLDGTLDVRLRGARAALEHKGDGLVALAAELLLDEGLGVVQDHGSELCALRAGAMHVAEGGGDGEVAIGD
mmetsp:Transcript_27557/g.64256  ORF Transcript_27557/g.64256 Transcript_27557/m.64256 type:complete len:270 (+) Transcript_27557:966-1775(+)